MVHGTPDFFFKTREKGLQTFTEKRLGDLAAQTNETMYDQVGIDVELVHFEFATNYKECLMQIKAYKSDGALGDAINTMKYDGTTFVVVSPEQLNLYESIMWLELVYDEVNDRYKFGLGYPIRFANGCQILIRNPDSSTHKIAAMLAVLERG